MQHAPVTPHTSFTLKMNTDSSLHLWYIKNWLGDSHGTAALQENLESPSLGGDGGFQPLLQSCPMLPPLSSTTTAALMIIYNSSLSHIEGCSAKPADYISWVWGIWSREQVYTKGCPQLQWWTVGMRGQLFMVEHAWNLIVCLPMRHRRFMSDWYSFSGLGHTLHRDFCRMLLFPKQNWWSKQQAVSKNLLP